MIESSNNLKFMRHTPMGNTCLAIDLLNTVKAEAEANLEKCSHDSAFEEFVLKVLAMTSLANKAMDELFFYVELKEDTEVKS